MESYDVAVIGGGIIGCSAANHLTAAGFRTILLERGDIGGATSGRTSRLQYCGLSYFSRFRSVLGALAHPVEKTVQAVSFTYDRRQWKVLDKTIQPDLDFLKAASEGELEITGRTLDDKRWTVAYLSDSGPVKFYIYDRAPERKVTYLFSSNTEEYPVPAARPSVSSNSRGRSRTGYCSPAHSTTPVA